MLKQRMIALVGVVAVAIGFTLASEQTHQAFQPEQFEKPDRAAWQKPDEVVARLKLKPGEIIADIGAGSGYFTRQLAHAVEPGGIAYAVDIDANMLRYIYGRAEKENQHNIVTVLCAENDPMLAPNSVDLIFICNTIHHISNRSDYYKRLQRCLRPAGRLVIVDFQKKKLPISGPPLSMRIAKESMLEEMKNAGFKLLEDVDLLPYQYFLILQTTKGNP